MKKIIWGFFCVLFLFASISVCAEENADPAADISLYATAAVLMDADSGRVLYGKNADQPMAMASTTKIMTCIVVLERTSLDDTLTVSDYASGMPKVKLYLKKGEQYTVRDLLYSLMLESHNDSAVALAEYVGKQYLSEDLRNKSTDQYTVEESKQAVAAFAKLMNEKAVELGCENTWFITPNGLDATQEFTLQDGTVIRKEHCTTASELARIMAYCIEESPARENFLEITRTANYSFSANGRSFSCTNHNAFLNMMDGAVSGKTGFTNKAGYCYVGALERDGRTFVVALLACGWPNNKTWKWSDTRELMQYGIDNFFYRSFSEKGIAFDENRLKPIPVQNGRTNILGETAYTDIEIKGRRDMEHGGMDTVAVGTDQGWQEGILLRDDEKICVEYHMESVLQAPVKSGEEVGIIEYSVDGIVYRQEKIVTTESVDRIDFTWCMEEILSRFLIMK
ncbi:MAG: D-alanyl-D-alanine carboxypeptidase family protein [Acetatifactor sp.]